MNHHKVELGLRPPYVRFKNKKELIEICKEKKIKYNRLKKNEIINLIQQIVTQPDDIIIHQSVNMKHCLNLV
jgi:hypothetical protein